MTIKLYDSNPYISSCQADVKQMIEKDGRFHVVLDQTIFHPRNGLQSCDDGTINEIEVMDVFEEESTIYHVLPQPLKESKVFCKIDFEKRFDSMQQHTGQQLLSKVIYNTYKGKTLGFQLREEYGIIDISLQVLSEEMIHRIEITANELIHKNLNVKNELLGQVHGNCYGTYMKNTGEVGLIKIMTVEQQQGSSRVYFKCGARAFLDYQHKDIILSALAKHFSISENHILDQVKKDTVNIKNMTEEIKELKKILYQYKAVELICESDSTFLFQQYTDLCFKDVQGIADRIIDLGDYICVLSSLPDLKIAIGHSGKYAIDAGAIVKEKLSIYGGKGKGNKERAQAAFLSQKDLIRFENHLRQELKKLRTD